MYSFKICELVSGKVLDELPMEVDSDLTRSLQHYGEGTLSLPLFDGRGDLVSSTWEQAILPWRSLILLVDDTDRIVWHGIPQSRNRGKEYTPTYPCRTIESYLIRRYTPDMTFALQDQAQIFRALIGAASVGGVGLEIVAPLTGRLRDKTYADDENARIFDRLNELAALEDGFDWTVDVVWGDDNHTYVRKIARMGYPHLGNRTDNPVHTFELGQNIIDFGFAEPWGEGDAATHVRAIGDGEGTSKVMSAPVVDTVREAAGWPRLEERRSFSGVTIQSTIESHAKRLSAALFGGQRVLTLEVRDPGVGEDFTRLSDLTLGDSARIVIDTPQLKLETVWVVVGWSIKNLSGPYTVTIARLGEPTNGG